MARNIYRAKGITLNNKKLIGTDTHVISEIESNGNCIIFNSKPKKYTVDVLGEPPVTQGGGDIVSYALYPVANKMFNGLLALDQEGLIAYIEQLIGATEGAIPIGYTAYLIPVSDDETDISLWRGWAENWQIFSLDTKGVLEGRAPTSSILGHVYLDCHKVDEDTYIGEPKIIDEAFLKSDLFESLKTLRLAYMETMLGNCYALYTGDGPDLTYTKFVEEHPTYPIYNLYNKGIPVTTPQVSADSLEDFKFGTARIPNENGNFVPGTPGYPDEYSNPFAEGETVILGDPDHFKISPNWCGSDYGKLMNIDYYEAENNSMPNDSNTHGHIELRRAHIQCLAGNTIIKMADKSVKRLDQIHEGDLVWTTHGPENVIYSDSLLNKIGNKCIDIILDNNIKITVIKNHRFYNKTKNKFVHATSLKLGDTLVTDDGAAHKIKIIKSYKQDTKHYTIITDGCNMYSANGIITGNRASNIRWKWLRKLYLKLFLFFIGGTK